MSLEQWNMERILFERIFQHFKRLKVNISDAIKKPFPFFEILRDNELITKKMYDDFKDSCTNLVPVKNVVYKALEVLEKKLNQKVLEILFTEENLKAYPDLEFIAKSFEEVSQNQLCFLRSDRGHPKSQLCLEQGFSLVEDLDETVQTNGVRGDTTGDNADGWERRQATVGQGAGSMLEEPCEQELNGRHPHLEPHPALPQNKERAVQLSHGSQTQPCFVHLVDIKRENSSFSLDGEQHNQASETIGAVLLSCGSQINPCSVHLVDTKEKNSSFSLDGEQQTQARTNPHQASDIIVISDDSNDGNNSEEPSTSIICQSNPLDSRDPHTSTMANKRGATSNTDSSSTSKRPRWIRRKKRDRHGKYSIRNIKMPLEIIRRKAFSRRYINSSLQRSKKRGPRIPKQTHVDFNRPELPVTCGDAQGILYKEIYQEGIHKKSILSETGDWLTLIEFEIKGNRERSKKWKQSIRCYGYTLEELIKENLLPDPSRKRRKTGQENPPNPRRTNKKLKNSKKCKVCRGGRKLFCCAICEKFYHKKCHIPPVEDKSGWWSCVFCKIKDLLRCQENQACYKESEVLERKMLPEEQLKCEWLLLSIYCHPKGHFFITKPKKRGQEFPELRENMWLARIKYRLIKKAYHSVQHFVKDMRLIFLNYSVINKNSKFSNRGVIVGSLFEENFKTIFSINDTSKQPQL